MKKKLTKVLKCEDGSGLVLALMTLMVLSVLGLSLGAITIGSHRLSSVNRDTTSAYYIAEAGVNQAYEEIKAVVKEAYINNENKNGYFDDIADSLDDIKVNVEKIDFENQFGVKPSISIKISQLNHDQPRAYIIESTGNLSDKHRSVNKVVNIDWKEKNQSGGLIPDIGNTSAFISESLKLDSSYFKGDVLIQSLKPQPFTISNSGNNILDIDRIYYNPDNRSNILGGTGIGKFNYLNEKLTAQEQVMDFALLASHMKGFIDESKNTLPVLQRNLENQDNSSITLDKDYYKDTFKISGHNRIIDIGDREINLVVNNLEFNWGSTNVRGSGMLNIYVKNEIKNNDGGQAVNLDSQNSNLRIFHLNENSNSYQISNNNKIKAFIITPNSNVEITGNGTLQGLIVAKSLTVHNNGTLNFVPHQFPFADSSNSSESETDDVDLISHDPITEPR